MSRRILEYIALVLSALLTSCSVTPEAFPAGTEFGGRVEGVLNTISTDSIPFRLIIEYPETFRGALVEGASSLGKATNTVTLSLNSLLHDETRLCVSGDLVAVANSKNVRGRDDNDIPITFQNFRPSTTTMVTTQVCTGQMGQQTCLPMTYPVTIPGPLSIHLRGEKGHISLKRGSFIVLHLSDGRCGSPASAK